MAIYSTFFLCDPRKLPSGFPDWKSPLPAPVTRKTLNPFTRQEVSITSCAPEWDDCDLDEMEMPEYQVVAVEGDYGEYLNGRIPTFVQSQPHRCTKNLTTVEMEPLVAAALGVETISLPSALYAHPSLGSSIEAFPDALVAKLKSMDNAAVQSLAEKWATRMSMPEFTHSVNGNRLYDDWAVDDALELLVPIVDLAKLQSPEQTMYLLIET